LIEAYFFSALTFAHRRRCAAPILARASADIVRRFLAFLAPVARRPRRGFIDSSEKGDGTPNPRIALAIRS
jgi:hypothetical protein